MNTNGLYAVYVGDGFPAGYMREPHVHEFIQRYLATCWPNADPTPCDSLPGPVVSYFLHRVPEDERPDGELLIRVERIHEWKPDDYWPRKTDVTA